ncbi:hypothetical protein EV175_005660, partial [Coemansia sp. RSA 1933]
MPHHSLVSQNRDYQDSSAHSPVPSLTNEASRSSSVSSSVNSLSPDTLVTTPRDLMPHFKSSSVAGTAPAADTKKRSLPADDSTQSTHGMVDDGTAHKRRRESSDGSTEESSSPMAQAGDMERKVKRRVAEQQPRQKKDKSRKRPLTGDVDFVTRFGLVGLYREFVRPYVGGGEGRQQLPDLASAYLKNVKGSVHHPPGASFDLLGLVMAPPKNEFDSLDLLPMASIRAAFNIGTRPAVDGGDGSSDGLKRSRISLKMSSTHSQTPSPRHGSHGSRQQPHNSVK